MLARLSEEGMPMSKFLHDMFGVRKPVIAMAHFPALPGAPRYNTAGDLEGLIDSMRQDIQHLSHAGVDAILFCNEDDRPYGLDADFEAVAVMPRVITELRPSLGSRIS